MGFPVFTFVGALRPPLAPGILDGGFSPFAGEAAGVGAPRSRVVALPLTVCFGTAKIG